jgi:L-idonate 5-dehydrogenase
LLVEDVEEPSPGPHEVVVRLGAGGICGSDLHYFAEGRNGDFKLREPMIIGHEAAGVVARVGSEVRSVKPGDHVVVNPAQTCGNCRQCRAGRSNLCENVRFVGSAAFFPHEQGIFSELFLIRDENCHVLPSRLSFRAAACAEPLAVAFRAVAQAGSLLNRDVLIVGSGPIGVLVAAAARLGGAARIGVIDLFDEPLSIARVMGATETVNARTDPERLAAYTAGKGIFDVAIEASGSFAGFATALEATRPGGTIVQVGVLPAGQSAAPLSRVCQCELRLIGSCRYNREYDFAVEALIAGRIDVAPLLTHEFTFAELEQAFLTAADKQKSMKVSLRPS